MQRSVLQQTISTRACLLAAEPAYKCLGDCTNANKGCDRFDCYTQATGVASSQGCDVCTPVGDGQPVCKAKSLLDTSIYSIGSCKENSAVSVCALRACCSSTSRAVGVHVQDKCVCEYTCTNCAKGVACAGSDKRAVTVTTTPTITTTTTMAASKGGKGKK